MLKTNTPNKEWWGFYFLSSSSGDEDVEVWWRETGDCGAAVEEDSHDSRGVNASVSLELQGRTDGLDCEEEQVVYDEVVYDEVVYGGVILNHLTN